MGGLGHSVRIQFVDSNTKLKLVLATANALALRSASVKQAGLGTCVKIRNASKSLGMRRTYAVVMEIVHNQALVVVMTASTERIAQQRNVEWMQPRG
jgi:hypothetical protein